MAEPIKPEKANNKSPVIRIAIDPSSFKELLVYDHLQFQLDANETNFNPKDTSVEWSNVELQKGNDKRLYTVKFSNAIRSVSYAARPVLEGEDYDKALKKFEKINREYKKEVNERLKKQKEIREQYLNDSLENMKMAEENKRIEKLNILIEARTREVEKQNAMIEKQNTMIEKQNAIVEKQNMLNRETAQFNKLIRSFQLDLFGVWNCDKIFLNCLPIVAIFKDERGAPLDLTNVAVLSKSFNGIFNFSCNKIFVVKDADNMVIGVYNGRFAYSTPEDYKKQKINTETKEQTFIMTVVSERDNNYAFIKKVAGL